MRTTRDDGPLIDAIRSAALALGEGGDYQAIVDLVGDAHVVLLGEASHGTHEFYAGRARITQALIERKGFHAVAVEGDWPDAHRVNRFVRGLGQDASAEESLRGFQRFPTWMWRNTVVVEFIEWLREHNRIRPQDQQAGFYGLDLYSLHASMEAVLAYLDVHDPAAARRARDRYACFDQYGEDSQLYGLMTGVGGSDNCAEQVMRTLIELRRHATTNQDSPSHSESAFDAEQNARLICNAEEYYRTMYWREVSSWNLRDQHMADTLFELDTHLSSTDKPAKVVVWAHNSHLGDARATEMGRQRGELNLGQLVRERHGDDAVLVGFSTHTGHVTAAFDWGAAAERKRVRPSHVNSHERLMHMAATERFLLLLRGNEALAHALGKPRLERAIGVIYRPDTERHSHYFEAHLPSQFDALIHIGHGPSLTSEARPANPLLRLPGSPTRRSTP